MATRVESPSDWMSERTDESRQPRGRTRGRGACDCCPYGYHLELDFVRYCEKISMSSLLRSPRSTLRRSRPTLPRQRRHSREVLLGLLPQDGVAGTAATPGAPGPTENGAARSYQRSSSEGLERAVHDFERIFNTSQTTLSNDYGRKSVEPGTLDIQHLSPAGESHREQPDDPKLPRPNNANPVILQEIRQQVAASLGRMKQLEEEVKIIPNLQNQLRKLRWENRRLVKLLEASEAKSEKNANLKPIPSVQEIHTRTIGTSCSVLHRDVGTCHVVSLTSTGTEAGRLESPRGVDAAAQTVTARRCLALDFGTQTELGLAQINTWETRSLESRRGVDAAAQTVAARRSFTLDLGTQTEIEVRVHTREAAVKHQHPTEPYKLTTILSPPQTQTKFSKCDIGIQYNSPADSKPTRNVGVQSEKKSKALKSFSDRSNQTDEKPVTQKKDVGLQKKPQYSHIGIIAKILVLSNSTQTNTILKKDIGLGVSISPQVTPKKAVGTNTDIERTVDKKFPTLFSRTTDTLDLLKTFSSAVNTTRIDRVDESTDTRGLEENTKTDTRNITKATAEKEVFAQNISFVSHTSSFVDEKPKVPAETDSEPFEEVLSENAKVGLEDQQSKCPALPLPDLPKPYEKKEPSKEMKGAMKVLNDSLLKSPSGDIPKNMRNAVNIVQQEWFKISSTADANPLDVEDYLDCFEELSVPLLEYIVNMTDVSGNTAMHYAVSNGNFDVVSILLDSKVCNINKLNTAGYTCIMLVALTKVKSDTDRQVVRRLFQMADVNIRARQHGQTALMLAVSHGRIDTVELLLESGADINIQDEDGSTALMCAAEHGYIDIVKLLLAQPDCDLSVTDLDGNTALNIAMDAGNRDIGVLLYAQEHFSRGTSPFNTLKVRRAKSATPTLKTRTPTPPNCSQEHSL